MPSLPDRPESLTKDVQKQILKHVRDGNFFEPSCVASGVSRDTVDYWQRRYEAGEEVAQKYADFFVALARARAEAELEAVVDVKTGRPGWQGQAWFLERRYRGRWGQRKQLNITQNTQGEMILEKPSNGRTREDTDTTAGGSAT